MYWFRSNKISYFINISLKNTFFGALNKFLSIVISAYGFKIVACRKLIWLRISCYNNHNQPNVCLLTYPLCKLMHTKLFNWKIHEPIDHCVNGTFQIGLITKVLKGQTNDTYSQLFLPRNMFFSLQGPYCICLKLIIEP